MGICKVCMHIMYFNCYVIGDVIHDFTATDLSLSSLRVLEVPQEDTIADVTPRSYDGLEMRISTLLMRSSRIHRYMDEISSS